MTINLDELERIAKAAPSGAWETHTSNSWRRMYAEQGRDRVRVLEPCTQHGTWPDLLFGDGVQKYLETFTPDAVSELLVEVRRLREILATPVFTAGHSYAVNAMVGLEGAHQDVAYDVFHNSDQPLTVFYGEKRVYTTLSQFLAAHPGARNG